MRTILHSDLNNFYASVEMLRYPELKAVPTVVVGSKEDRHGVVLAKNIPAAAAGVRTGDVYWQAKEKCGNLVELPADFDAYLKAARQVRTVYERYTDRVEAFGIDECWLDVTESLSLFGSGAVIAERIRAEVKGETGLTVSVGVSWNKVFAKLASDMKKPDAVTEITPDNYRDKVWPLPAGDLLYVGSATGRRLRKYNLFTIGDIANTDADRLTSWLGKWGAYLYVFANGLDETPVAKRDERQNVKSIGNSLTCYRDLGSDEDVYMLLLLLSDAVAARLRDSALGKARTVHLSVRDAALNRYAKQGKPAFPTRSAADIADCAFSLFRSVYPWEHDVRSLGVSVSGFVSGPEQTNIFADIVSEQKAARLEKVIAELRAQYGNNIIRRAAVLKDKRLAELDILNDHVIHPENFFGR